MIPLVSIVTPVYNRTRYLKEMVESVLFQSLRDWELLIVDDGSSQGDHIKNILSGYNDTRIFYYFQPHKGRSSARNLGITQSQGKYIAFLDSDDLWLPDALKILTEALQEKVAAGMVYGNFIKIDLAGKTIGHNHMKTFSGYVLPELLRRNFIYIGTALVKKEVFQRCGLFCPEIEIDEDWELWLRICREFPVYFVGSDVLKYRIQPHHNDPEYRCKMSESALRVLALTGKRAIMSINQKRERKRSLLNWKRAYQEWFWELLYLRYANRKFSRFWQSLFRYGRKCPTVLFQKKIVFTIPKTFFLFWKR